MQQVEHHEVSDRWTASPNQTLCRAYRSHLRDHLECASVIARQARLPTVFYLVGLALAATQEDEDKKQN